MDTKEEEDEKAFTAIAQGSNHLMKQLREYFAVHKMRFIVLAYSGERQAVLTNSPGPEEVMDQLIQALASINDGNAKIYKDERPTNMKVH